MQRATTKDSGKSWLVKGLPGSGAQLALPPMNFPNDSDRFPGRSDKTATGCLAKLQESTRVLDLSGFVGRTWCLQFCASSSLTSLPGDRSVAQFFADDQALLRSRWSRQKCADAFSIGFDKGLVLVWRDW